MRLTRRWQNGQGYRTQPLFSRAIKKYGWDQFSHEVIATGLSKEDAELMEIKLIAKYKTDNPAFGYNIEHGGNTLGTHSEETKRKISEAQMGPKNHAYGKPSPMKGRKASPEAVEKNRESHKGQASYWKGKHLPESVKEKLRKPKSEDTKRKLSEARSVPVLCIETGVVYPSGKAAGDALGISRGSIAYVVKGQRKTAGGFHWKIFKEE